MSVLVWIEQNEGATGVVASSWEALGAGQQVAEGLGLPLIAVVIGAETAASADLALRYGADLVLTIEDPALADYRLSAYAQALEQAISDVEATTVIMSATARGRELSATVAAARQAGLAPDIVDLRIEQEQVVAVRSLYSGNILADVQFSSPLQVISVRPRSFPIPELADAHGERQPVSISLAAEQIAEQVLAKESSNGGEISLTDAKIIVSGGRGVAADPVKGFALVAELAQTLGAAVGASRAAVDAGYIPYKHQVGQTGKTVRPDLYIAAGISGAIQHLAGMGGSKLIVAINKDADTPIFKQARYGVVGDLFVMVPALNAEFKKKLGE
ncbi:MAG TPA: electron transfer flavoprotein subunit alpha/FixB family protein [Caldilineaceae bacterium]|nr:electron transfer flavoprotein subunit alpha/FixB family protein [Caldilineaceae bacterium]